MIQTNINIEIEVACFMSSFPNTTGVCAGKGKGRTPKEERTCESILGHAVKSRMTVIVKGWGAIGKK